MFVCHQMHLSWVIQHTGLTVNYYHTSAYKRGEVIREEFGWAWSVGLKNDSRQQSEKHHLWSHSVPVPRLSFGCSANQDSPRPVYARGKRLGSTKPRLCHWPMWPLERYLILLYFSFHLFNSSIETASSSWQGLPHIVPVKNNGLHSWLGPFFSH